MAAALEELINNIQEMVQEAWTLPLSSDKCVIERERMLDLIDELRSTLPGRHQDGRRDRTAEKPDDERRPPRA